MAKFRETGTESPKVRDFLDSLHLAISEVDQSLTLPLFVIDLRNTVG